MATGDDMEPDRGLSVLLVCPHRLEGEGLRLTVERDEDMWVVGLAGSAAEALGLARETQPDVVLLGWGWSGTECIGTLERIRRGDPPLNVLVVSADTHPTQVQRVVQAGASGILPADVHPDDLIHAMRSAARGDQLILHRSVAPAFLSRAASGTGRTGSDGRFDSLTPREREVVGLLARGLNDKDLAQSLFISVRTVQTHLSHIYQKLGAHTRTEVALMAVREGWASPTPDEGSPESP